MRSALSFFIGCSIAMNVHAQAPPITEGMATDTLKIQMNDLMIDLVKYSYGTGINFLVIHDNEDTGTQAALEYIKKAGGRLIDPQYGNTRNFKFSCGDHQHEADPNSIYTRSGIYTGLTKFGSWKQQAADQLEVAGKTILNFYGPEQLGYIITLHNNLDSGFNITSYLPGNKLGSAASEVFINPEMDTDDLVFVTERSHYEYLKDQNVNVVLQSPDAPNDGSLSVYAMYRGIPYINVEVQHGHLGENIRLINLVSAMLQKQKALSR